MKFAVLALIGLASVNAMTIKNAPVTKKPEDPLKDFDDKHYANNKVDSLFPDHTPIPTTATVSPHEFPTIHTQKNAPGGKKPDYLDDFDNKHYANNKVDSTFPDHVPIPETATVGPHDFPGIHSQKNAPSGKKPGDGLTDFDDNHYANNKVDTLFPDHEPIPKTATVGPHDFPTIHS